MKKTGFTLAEVLITLMILGIIASLTIPSLIQNTQKREEVVQLKKGMSMINQAVTMNYALTQKDLSDYADTAAVIAMLKERLAVVASGATWVRTQDGLTYYVGDDNVASCTAGTPINPAQANASSGTQCYGIVIGTRPTATTDANAYDAAQGKIAGGSEAGVLTGFYQFYASTNSVVPTTASQTILNAEDVTKLTKSQLGTTSSSSSSSSGG